MVPADQHCCGLPPLDGRPPLAHGAADDPRGSEGVGPTTSSAAASCAIAILHDYARLFEDDPAWRERAERLGATLDVLSFLGASLIRPR